VAVPLEINIVERLSGRANQVLKFYVKIGIFQVRRNLTSVHTGRNWLSAADSLAVIGEGGG
jgi:hypothetical protein